MTEKEMTVEQLEALLAHYTKCVTDLPYSTVQAFHYMDKAMETIERINALSSI
jgi:hypothetical protein